MKNIEDVKLFFEEFASIEAETETLKWKPNYKEYNANIDKANSFYLSPHNIQFTPRNYEKRTKGNVYSRLPRKLFKISEYFHNDHGKIWACYTSSANNGDTQSPYLTHILFVVQFEESFKIAASSIWSNYSKNGYGDEDYEWQQEFGKKHFQLNYLDKPVEIKRYHEPEDYKNGLKTYHADI